MGWLLALGCIAVLVVLVRKTVDKETARSMKSLGKLLSVVAVMVFLLVLLNSIR